MKACKLSGNSTQPLMVTACLEDHWTWQQYKQLQLRWVTYDLNHLIISNQYLLGDDLFSTPKASQSSWSLSNSDLGHLWHSLDSDHLQVPETLQSTSYSEFLPAVPNTTTCSFHSNPSPNTPSEGCSETSTSSEGNSETSSDSAPSNPNSTPMFFRDSPSCSGDRAAPTASDIKGCVTKVICNIKGWGWSGSVGNAGWWPWSWISVI